MVELVDIPVLEAGAERHASSSLAWGTKYIAAVAQLVEHHVANVNVTGSNPVSRSTQSVFGEMDIISVFETEGGSSILSRPAIVLVVQWIVQGPPKT